MEQSSKTLTFVVPAYNMETYLERCVESLLSATDNSDIEVLIVDDGSSDGTPELADMYERRWPGNVRAIHQVNKGHGGAVNTGIANATGMYVKVVDADDWVDMPSIDTLMGTLRVQRVATDPVDMIVTNYVYDKVGKRVKHTVNFRHAMAANTVLGWDDLGCFGVAEYILMHALIYRTQVVRDSGMQLPEHTFYVDFIYAYQPFPWVKSMLYMDIPFYHYFIGRDDQSVNEKVMITRLDQLARVNEAMTRALPPRADVEDKLWRYMVHYLRINAVVCSVMAQLSGTPEHLALKEQIWETMDQINPEATDRLRQDLLAGLVRHASSKVVRGGYKVAAAVLGFN